MKKEQLHHQLFSAIGKTFEQNIFADIKNAYEGIVHEFRLMNNH